MSREEEIKKAAFEYINQQTIIGELSVDDFVNGAKWADKTMIDKACELYRSELKQFEGLLIAYDKNAFTNLIDFENTINDFKKAMEEEI